MHKVKNKILQTLFLKDINNIAVFIIIVTLLKLILAGLFSSDYQNKMFYPFVGEMFNGNNPYQFYYEKKMISSFPYPTIMLFIESIGYFFSSLVSDNIFLKNLLFKLPLLIFDLIGLLVIIKIFPNQRKSLTYIYYSSPIIIYSIYMHGQLDIIPIVLLVISINFLINSNSKYHFLFILFLAFSIMSKQHILAVVPIIIMYIYKKYGLKKSISTLIRLIFIIGALCIPFMSQGFISNVLFNEEQNRITTVFIQYNNVSLYIPIVATLLIYLKVFSLNSMNKDLLFSFCGITFSVFLAFVSPMPGWFV